jgi:hypothetical protein
MTATELLEKLKKLGSEQTRKTLMKHGAKEPCWGVRIGDMKPLLKEARHDQALALELFDSGVYDAMYLAGLIADGSKMTRAELNSWALAAYGSGISEYTVPWVASEHPEGFSMALEWIESPVEEVAVTGWATLGSIVSVKPDDELDLALITTLLQRVEKEVHQSPNRVRYVMNGFVIAAGSYVAGLTETCLRLASAIGPVTVNMGGTACQVPLAAEYILKVRDHGSIGKKRKTAKC